MTIFFRRGLQFSIRACLNQMKLTRISSSRNFPGQEGSTIDRYINFAVSLSANPSFYPAFYVTACLSHWLVVCVPIRLADDELSRIFGFARCGAHEQITSHSTKLPTKPFH